MLRDDVIMLAESDITSLNIPVGSIVQLTFGSFRKHVFVIPTRSNKKTLAIHSSLSCSTGLISQCLLHLRYNVEQRILQIGPLIGVVLTREHPEDSEKPLGTVTMFCEELVAACRQQGGFIYFFTPKDVVNVEERLQGWVYNKKWKKIPVPLPDVINNRLTSRKLENSTCIQSFIARTKQDYGTITFNQKFLEKNEVFAALKDVSTVEHILPRSHLLKSFNTLQTMCRKYPVVFIKPIRGSLGKGIIRITRLQQETYEALLTHVGGTERKVYSSLQKLYSSLSSKIKRVKYQIQQGIPLITNSGRTVDFRALVQKDNFGEWKVTSIVARIAGGDHYVSNVARGGTMSTVREAIAKSELPSSFQKTSYARLRNAALDIAKGIEKKIDGHFGELGVDLALDKQGAVWLIEVNSKPSKNENTSLDATKIRPSVKSMLAYCGFLFKSKK